MGAGVYENSFDGLGVTFLVNPFENITEEACSTRIAEDDFMSTIEKVVNNFDGSMRPVKSWSNSDDMFTVAHIDSTMGRLNIYLKDWENDLVIGVAPDIDTREELLGFEDKDNPDIILDCIDQYGVKPEKIEEKLLDQVQAVKRDLIAFLQEDGYEPRYKTSGYTTSPYPTMLPVHPENDEEAKRQKDIRLKPFLADFTYQDKLEAMEDLIEKVGLSAYYFVVNKDERGEYNADVRGMFSGETIFEIKSDINGEIPEVRDGFMEDLEDVEGLEEYLKEQKIIGQDDTLWSEYFIKKVFGNKRYFLKFAQEYEEIKTVLEKDENTFSPC